MAEEATAEPYLAICGTARRVLEELLLRHVGPLPQGKLPAELSPTQRTEALEPYQAELAADMGLLGECLNQARFLGLDNANQALHATPELDHAMADEAFQFAVDLTLNPGGDGG